VSDADGPRESEVRGDPRGTVGHHHHGPHWLDRPRAPHSGARPDIPESARYRLKRFLLGPSLVSDELHGERLGKPTALAVLSSDVMSSCAYGTKSILRILVPAVGHHRAAPLTTSKGAP
jgi:hypothetical protein